MKANTPFAVLTIVACSSCSGSAGGSVLPPFEDMDPEVVAAAEEVLSESQQPDLALQEYIDVVFEELDGSDLTSTLPVVQASGLSVLTTQGDLEALVDVVINAGSIFELDTTAGIEPSPVELCPISEQETILYYVNGIYTTPQAAGEGLSTIAAAINAANPTVAADLRYKLFYNKSGVEALTVQNVCNFVGLPFSLIDTDPKELFGTFVGTILTPYYLAQKALFELCIALFGGGGDLIESAQQYMEQVGLPVAPPEDVAKFAAALTQDVQSGKRVIIVAHSQGNYFTQQAIAQMPVDAYGPTSNAVGVVALASPAAYLGSGGFGSFQHLTLAEDIITLVPGALESNISNQLTDSITNPICPLCSEGIVVHGLGTGYFAFAESRAQVVDAVIADHGTLVNPRDAAGQGFLQATLTWDTPGDIDLHIFEPTGEHVFWMDKLGDVGELDKDDIPGTGPENYFVCTAEQMIEGPYSVLVNNYNGTTGTLATIAIKAGSQIDSFQLVMGSPNQGANLVPVATVVYENGLFSIIPEP